MRHGCITVTYCLTPKRHTKLQTKANLLLLYEKVKLLNEFGRKDMPEVCFSVLFSFTTKQKQKTSNLKKSLKGGKTNVGLYMFPPTTHESWASGGI